MGKKLFTYILMMLLVACSDKRSSNTKEEIRLTDGENTQSFIMPGGLKAGQLTKSLLRFTVQYPSMSARDWQGTPQDDEIAVWVSLGSEVGGTESLVKQAAKKIDTSLPGQFYHDGKQGAFEIYKGMLDKTTLVPQVVIYVFRDDDGQLVGIEDPGSWSRAYNVRRKIGSKIHVRYNISKPLGRNFVEIDKAIKNFILKHAKP